MIAAFLGCCFSGKAQNKEVADNLSNMAMTFLTLPVDASSAGQGEMGVATLPDGYAHSNNAAKYIFLDAGIKGGGQLFYLPWLRQLVKDMSVSGASGFYRIDDLQVVSTSFRYFSMGSLQYVDEQQQQSGDLNPYELAVDVAYSRRLSRTFSLSLGFRYGVSDVADDENAFYKYHAAHTIAFDLSGYYRKEVALFGQEGIWGMGFAVTNIGNRVKYADNRIFFQPATLKAGVNLTALFERSCLSLGVEFNKYLVASDGDPARSVFENIGASFTSGAQLEKMVQKIGMEYRFHDFLSGRIGYFHENRERGNRRYLTFGAGLSYKNIHLEGAYLVPVSERITPLENTFRLSAGFRIYK